MKYLFYIIFVILFFSGCEPKECVPTPPKTEFVKTQCPLFKAKLSIRVEDHNETHGAMSWEDITKVTGFLKAKKNFNVRVEELNSK